MSRENDVQNINPTKHVKPETIWHTGKSSLPNPILWGGGGTLPYTLGGGGGTPCLHYLTLYFWGGGAPHALTTHFLTLYLRGGGGTPCTHFSLPTLYFGGGGHPMPSLPNPTLYFGGGGGAPHVLTTHFLTLHLRGGGGTPCPHYFTT